MIFHFRDRVAFNDSLEYLPLRVNSFCNGIHNIPCYFEGETLFSYFFRVADCNGLTHIRQLFDLVDGNSDVADTWKRYYWAGYDFVYPQILGCFSFLDDRNFILESSLLRFFSLFCSSDYIARKVRAYTYPNLNNEHILHDVPNLYGKPKVCKMCIAEDLENLGFFYIRNIHQLPGVTVCLKHKQMLSEYVGTYGKELNMDSYFDIEANGEANLGIKYAEFIISLYTSKAEGCLYTTVLTVINKVLSVTGQSEIRHALEILFSQSKYSIIREYSKYLSRLLFHNSSNSCDIDKFVLFIALLYDWDVSKFIQDLECNRIDYRTDFDKAIEDRYRLVSPYSSICNTIESLAGERQWTVSVVSLLEGWPTPDESILLNQRDIFVRLFEHNCSGYEYLADFMAWHYRIPVKEISSGKVHKIRADRLISIVPQIHKDDIPIETRMRMAVEADGRFLLVAMRDSGPSLLLRIRCLSCGGIFDVYAKDFCASCYCRLCGYERSLTEAKVKELVKSISFSRYTWSGNLEDGIYTAFGDDEIEASTFENLKEKIRVRVRGISGNASISELCMIIRNAVQIHPEDVYFNEDFIQFGYKQDIRNAINRLVGRGTVVHHGIGVFTASSRVVSTTELLDAKYFLRHGKIIGIPVGDTLLRHIGVILENEEFAYALYRGKRTTLHIDRRQLAGVEVSIVFTDIEISEDNWKIISLLLTFDNPRLITDWSEYNKMALYAWCARNDISIASIVAFSKYFTRKTIDCIIAFLKGEEKW